MRLTLGRRGLRTSLVAASVVIALGLLLVQIARAPETYPWGDTAITSITTLRVADGSLSTGAYSRFHWNHPGPLLYQVLAPLYELSGHREISIKWTVLMLNIGALAGLLTVVARPAPLLSIFIALALAPLVYREQRLLFWAWNPIVPLLPMALATALSARIATGTLGFLPLFCAVGSFAVQAHVGFAPVVLSAVRHDDGRGRVENLATAVRAGEEGDQSSDPDLRSRHRGALGGAGGARIQHLRQKSVEAGPVLLHHAAAGARVGNDVRHHGQSAGRPADAVDGRSRPTSRRRRTQRGRFSLPRRFSSRCLPAQASARSAAAHPFMAPSP